MVLVVLLETRDLSFATDQSESSISKSHVIKIINTQVIHYEALNFSAFFLGLLWGITSAAQGFCSSLRHCFSLLCFTQS